MTDAAPGSYEALRTPSAAERKVVRAQVRGSTLLLVGRVCSLALNLITQVIIVRALSKSGFGALAYALSLIEMFSIASLIALDKSILRYGAIYKERRDRPRLAGALALAIAVPVMCGVAFVAVMEWNESEIQRRLSLDAASWPLLLILAWLIPANGIASVTQSAANVVYGARSLFWRKHLLSPLIKVTAVSLAAISGSTPGQMAFALAIAGGLGLIADGWLLARICRDEQLWQEFSPRRWRLPIRELLGDSLPVLASDLTFLFRGALLVVLVGWWCVPEVVASFRAVLPVAKLNELVLINFMMIFVPLASRLHAVRQDDELWAAHRQTNLWILTLSFPVFAAIAALAEPASVLLFGLPYADAAHVLILLAAAYFLQAIYGMDGHLLRVLGRVRVLLAVDLAGSAVLGLAAYWLIPSWGAIGAALAAIIGIGLHGELRRWCLTRAASQATSHAGRRAQLVILALAVNVACLSWMLTPGWIVGGFIAASASLAAVFAMRHQLDVDGTLPELRKLPGARWILPRREESTRPKSDQTRVAYVMSRFPKLTETFVLREMVELEKSGVAVGVYPLQRERTDKVHPAALPFVQRACFTPWVSPEILASNLDVCLRNPLRYFATFGILLRANFGCPRYFCGAVGFFPKIVYLAERMRADGVRHVHAHFASHPAMAAWTIHRLAGIPYSFTAHGSDLHRDRHMLREKVAGAKAVIAISEYNRRMILDECGETFAGKVRVVHCGINPHDFPPRTEATPFERGQGPIQIICVGTQHEVKGQRYLLEACRQLKLAGLKFRCRFVGDGPDRAALERLTNEFALQDRIEFCGSRTTDDVRRLLSECDIIVAPSVPTADGRREGIPVVLMEGMGSGLVAVASRLSGIPELVRDEETGLLVPPRDADALAAAILRLAHNPELRQRLSRNGCELVLREFDVVANTHALREIIFGAPGDVVESVPLEISDRREASCPV